ncbi:cyclic nucleotide-binding domain-containing protein [Orrella sp. 11846]|uniref:cyclic nucleotide-binding domain-containing protein n=1 Tax=Orrella sp. 11846 TaxID=3409913 RepID=UPI003B5B9421
MNVAHGFWQALAGHWDQLIWLWVIIALLLTGLLLRQQRQAAVFTGILLGLFAALILSSSLAQALNSTKTATFTYQIAIFILGILIIRLCGMLMFRRMLPQFEIKPPRILEELLILFGYVAWLLIRLSSAGLDLGSLVASTAVLTAVIAFAMQDTLGNILSGLALQLDHSITIGDWIVLEDGTHGEVIEVQWRHTALRTLFNEIIIIPNSQLMRGQVKIDGGKSIPRRRETVFFYGSFDQDPSHIIETVQASLLRVQIEGTDHTQTPVIQATSFENGVITYAVRYWLTDPQQVGMSASQIRCHVYTVFKRHGWVLGTPTMDLGLMTQAHKYRTDADLEEVKQNQASLASVPLLSLLTDSELQALATRLKLQSFIAGSVLIRQGEPGTSLFILVSGTADVWLRQGAKQHIVAQVGPNDLVGEMSLLTGEPRSATVITTSYVQCYIIDKQDLEEILQKRPELAQTLADLIEARGHALVNLRDTASNQTNHKPSELAVLERIRSWFGLSKKL